MEMLAREVANDFMRTMAEEGFDSFQEMCDCYWWTSKDIKDEVKAIISNLHRDDCFLDDDGVDVVCGDEMLSYVKFSRKFRQYL